MHAYLLNHDVHPMLQSAYRQGHSTDTAFLKDTNGHELPTCGAIVFHSTLVLEIRLNTLSSYQVSEKALA